MDKKDFFAKPLFVTGCARSGTSALAEYLNVHPEILVCRERYKQFPLKVAPDMFRFERILDFREEEKILPSRQNYHRELLKRKDPYKIKWIGDKNPAYVRFLNRLYKCNPGARFMVIYRPVEEVAESFQARANNPNDICPSENGFEVGVNFYNNALRSVREFMEGKFKPEVLLLCYDDFFRGECVELISCFLEIQIDESVRGAWNEMNRLFVSSRREKAEFTEGQKTLIMENTDHDAQKWILDRIDQQRAKYGIR